ncbi:MAG: WD40 repeat domain-containing protein [Propionicimonas sp.]
MTLLESGSFRPTGRPFELAGTPCCLAAGPHDSAFVIYGGAGVATYWNVPGNHWALVDLDAGITDAEGTLDVKAPVWAAMSPDGRYAAATGDNGEVEIIDLRSGRPVGGPVTRGQAAGVYWAAFSQDGSRLVTTAVDGSVVLWDTRRAEVRATVQISGNQDGWAPNAAEFRPDGRTLLIAPELGHALYVWDPSAERAIAFACRMAGRDLSEAEWAENFPGQTFQHVCPGK